MIGGCVSAIGSWRSAILQSRRHGHGRYRVLDRPRHRQWSLYGLHPDRCADQSRQLRRADLRHQRPRRRHEHRDLLALGRQRRHRLRRSGDHDSEPSSISSRRRGSVDRGWLGVQIQDFTPELASSMSLKDHQGRDRRRGRRRQPRRSARASPRRRRRRAQRHRCRRFQGADASGGGAQGRADGDVHRAARRRAAHAHGDDREARCRAHGVGRPGPGRRNRARSG